MTSWFIHTLFVLGRSKLFWCSTKGIHKWINKDVIDSKYVCLQANSNWSCVMVWFVQKYMLILQNHTIIKAIYRHFFWKKRWPTYCSLQQEDEQLVDVCRKAVVHSLVTLTNFVTILKALVPPIHPPTSSYKLESPLTIFFFFGVESLGRKSRRMRRTWGESDFCT